MTPLKKINYDKEMQNVIAGLSGLKEPPSILLHSCCGPCSSSVILRLAPFFKITVFYYNPNIDTAAEYKKRAGEQKHIISIYNNDEVSAFPIRIIEEDYCSGDFSEAAQGLEDCREGGLRCMRCYFLRLKKTAVRAAADGFDFFSSTLSVSPLKKAEKINRIGNYLSKESCRWLPSDFKKRNGYLDSITLSKRFGLYRQDYCGCAYSKLRTETSPSAAKSVQPVP